MKKSQLKSLIKEVLMETEYQKDFQQRMDLLWKDYRSTKGSRIATEEETYKAGFTDGYLSKGSGY